MKEEWFKTNNNSDDGRTIIEISNLGRIKRKNGKIEYSKLVNGKAVVYEKQ